MADGSRPTLGKRSLVGGDDEPEVFCADEQTAVEVDLERWQRLVQEVLRAEGVRGGTELSVIFVSEDDIAALNEQHMGADGSTDVLAFPLDAALVLAATDHGSRRGPDRSPPDPGEFPVLLGDVVLCPEVASRQAPEHAGSLEDELALLLVHGVLHVLGYDHDEPEVAEAMRTRERNLLEAHHWGGPAPERFRQDQE